MSIVDRFRQLDSQYGIQSLPTLVLFADGELKQQLIGSMGMD